MLRHAAGNPSHLLRQPTYHFVQPAPRQQERHELLPAGTKDDLRERQTTTLRSKRTKARPQDSLHETWARKFHPCARKLVMKLTNNPRLILITLFGPCVLLRRVRLICEDRYRAFYVHPVIGTLIQQISFANRFHFRSVVVLVVRRTSGVL